MAFKPKTKDSFKSIIKNYLLDGYVLRMDGRDEQPIEVFVRDAIKNLPTMRNIGLVEGVCDRIYCSHDIMREVCKELAETYSIRKVWCSWSGCCQYSTYGYYIDS